jgi:hypothetical protein
MIKLDQPAVTSPFKKVQQNVLFSTLTGDKPTACCSVAIAYFDRYCPVCLLVFYY